MRDGGERLGYWTASSALDEITPGSVKDPCLALHPAPSLADAFVDLVDPRVERTKQHHLLDIVTIAVYAVISGAETWTEVSHPHRCHQGLRSIHLCRPWVCKGPVP